MDKEPQKIDDAVGDCGIKSGMSAPSERGGNAEQEEPGRATPPPEYPHHQTRGRTAPPLTPDRRYLVVRGRLWRASNPHLAADVRAGLVADLMAARRAVAHAQAANDPSALREARGRVNLAKVALGERGAPWWEDGAPDMNRRLAKNSPYAAWFAALGK